MPPKKRAASASPPAKAAKAAKAAAKSAPKKGPKKATRQTAEQRENTVKVDPTTGQTRSVVVITPPPPTPLEERPLDSAGVKFWEQYRKASKPTTGKVDEPQPEREPASSSQPGAASAAEDTCNVMTPAEEEQLVSELSAQLEEPSGGSASELSAQLEEPTGGSAKATDCGSDVVVAAVAAPATKPERDTAAAATEDSSQRDAGLGVAQFCPKP